MIQKNYKMAQRLSPEELCDSVAYTELQILIIPDL